MAYQHPLHYLLGMEGLALLRAYGGEHGPEFGAARIAEIRRLLDDPALAVDGVTAEPVDTVTGYRAWSDTYDRPGNGLYPIEEPFVHEIVDALPAGVALDAACGTGRHAEYLAARGHRVIGVDSSADMLAHARAKVPGAEFHEAPLDRLPLPDDHVDLAVCALALTHQPDLRPAFAELARVLRPGGHLVVTDVHHESVLFGSVPHVRTPAGEPRLIPSYRHRAADYLGAALPHGLEVRRCVEPRRAIGRTDEPMAAEIRTDVWDLWPWSLLEIAPAAYGGAWSETPNAFLWHFQLRAS
ncbi:class I SAM-dependent methyltransferase [Paractinoplanes globisporus]|uniref:Class I SAM-dependent methyltransferase n=1 Tax=Paractinoplanes globisporus TaxID=113565 RepID=A0ABW6W5A7_9ACTN|nr:class I SAM-dependent methyltransferase [Actinoplanes globisporus]